MSNIGQDAFTIGAASLIAGMFNLGASQPFVEKTQLQHQPQDQAACTVRFNRYDDGAPIDERYIDTPSAKSTQYGGFTHSGITYDQPAALNGADPTHIDGSFQAEAGLHNWHMPDNTYYESDSKWAFGEAYLGSSFGVEGVLYDSRYTNWTQSVEVEIDNPATCLSIRNELEKAHANPPEFNTWKNNSNDFAAKVWSKTGYPTDFDTLKETSGVTIIERETRLEQDRASGQLQSDYSTAPPAWKP